MRRIRTAVASPSLALLASMALETDVRRGTATITVADGAKLDEAPAGRADEAAGFKLRALEPIGPGEIFLYEFDLPDADAVRGRTVRLPGQGSPSPPHAPRHVPAGLTRTYPAALFATDAALEGP